MKTTETFRLGMSAAWLFVLLTGACAPRPFAPPAVLNESEFHPDPQNPDVKIYRNPRLKVTSYSAFLIEPATLVSNENAGRGLRPAQEADLVRSFREELVRQLQEGYRIADAPGPGVLRVRTRLYDIQPAHVELDEDKFLVLRFDTVLASAAMELECVDSVSGERVTALVHALRGRRYMDQDKTERLLNMRDAFSAWTASLRRRLDEATEKASGAPRESPRVLPPPDEDQRRKFEEGQ